MSESKLNTVKRGTDAAERLQQRAFAAPAVDIYENADELLLVADMPGVATGDLRVHFEKGHLSIEGRRESGPDHNPVAAEFLPIDFRRTFAVPQGIDPEKISADLRSGVLRVHLPKADALKPRQIQVRAS